MPELTTGDNAYHPWLDTWDASRCGEIRISADTIRRALHLPEHTVIVEARIDLDGIAHLVVSHPHLRARRGDDMPLLAPVMQREITPTEAALGHEGRVSFVSWGQ